jgi:hypothetical protein
VEQKKVSQKQEISTFFGYNLRGTSIFLEYNLIFDFLLIFIGISAETTVDLFTILLFHLESNTAVGSSNAVHHQ